MQDTANIIVPLLTVHGLLSNEKAGEDDAPIRDHFAADLAVVYAVGPPFGHRLISQRDLQAAGLTHRSLRRRAADQLDTMLGDATLHGGPPSLMVSFHGIESSLLAADRFWERLAPRVPGDLVVGVPARDVLIVTGSRSEPGLARARRCVDRVFFAGGRHLLSRDLLVWRDDGWEVFTAVPREPAATGSWLAP